MATETAAGHKEQAASSMVLLFELENLALAGRKRLYDLLKKHLAAAGVQVTPALFSRYGLGPTPEQSVAGLIEGLGAGKIDAAKIGAEVNEAYVADLQSKVEINTAVVKLVQAALKKGFAVGAVSALPEEQALVVLQRLDLNGDVKLGAHKPVEPLYPRADTWIKLLKSTCKTSVPAVAIVSSSSSGKAALAAGLRCVVLPDEFTGYQDFSGADIIVDSAADLSPSEVFATLGAK